ncbi:MAG: hypothetical protein U0165_07590 [Polyangiaceae bacterium]
MTRWVALSAATSALLAFEHDSHAIKIAVRGSAVVEAHVTSDGDAVVLRGALRDDVGLSIANATLQVSKSDGTILPLPKSCGDASTARLSQGSYVLDTDSAGAFCIRLPNLSRVGVLRVWFPGSPNLSASGVEVSLEPSNGMPTLSWDARPDVIDLDSPRVSLVVRAAAPDAGHPVQDLALGLFDGPKQIGVARVGTDSVALFDIATSEIEGPEVAELEVRSLDPHVRVNPLKAQAARIARVSLVGAAPTSPVIARDGFVIDVAATTSRGRVTNGTIEAVAGSEPVGVGTVVDGRASVKIAFDVAEPGSVRLDLRYLPSSVALRPGAPLSLSVPVRMPPFWRSIPLFVLGAIVLAWMARGWRRAPRELEREAPAQPERPVRAEVVYEPPANASEKGWRGIILDAHDRHAIEGARISVVTRDFLGERRLVQQTTGADGVFVFELPTPWTPMLTLVVESALHAKLSQPLPKPGRLSVAVVSRRRALIDRLVAIAAAAGGPWVPNVGDPTPGHVVSAANTEQRGDVERWARSVEGAAFGPHAVNEQIEAEVSALETDLRGNRPQVAGRR